MKGLDEAQLFYERYGKQMLETQFAECVDRVATGLVGHGSECFGFDDELSRDHDFGVGFCLWLTDEDYDKYGFRMSRAYTKLVREHGGTTDVNGGMFVGKGVHTVNEFYAYYIGNRLPETDFEWMAIDDEYLAEATNGRIFCDTYGLFTDIRNKLFARPNDVRLKKLACALLAAAQSGQYNLPRCLARGEYVAASQALAGFVDSAIGAAYLLCGKYKPYYKWAHRGLSQLPVLNELSALTDSLVRMSLEQTPPLVENICAVLQQAVRDMGLSDRTDNFLEGYAYCVNDKIRNVNLRVAAL